MQKPHRPNKKGTDQDIITLNSLGLSLATIGKIVHCHPTTVTARLQSLGIPPADTRRTFMEDIVYSITVEQRQWLSSQLGAHLSVKDYVKQLILQKYYESKTNDNSQHSSMVPTSNP